MQSATSKLEDWKGYRTSNTKTRHWKEYVAEITQIKKSKFHFEKYNPTHGGSFIELPKWVQSTIMSEINLLTWVTASMGLTTGSGLDLGFKARSLCKRDCGRVVDGKHVETAQRLPSGKKHLWCEN